MNNNTTGFFDFVFSIGMFVVLVCECKYPFSCFGGCHAHPFRSSEFVALICMHAIPFYCIEDTDTDTAINLDIYIETLTLFID